MTKAECPQVKTDRQRPLCQPSWLSFVGQTPIFEVEGEFHGKQSIYGIWKKSDLKRVSKSDHDIIQLIGDRHFVSHLGYRSSDKTRIRNWRRV